MRRSGPFARRSRLSTCVLQSMESSSSKPSPIAACLLVQSSDRKIPADGLDLDAVSVVVRDGAGTETTGAATILMDGPAGCLAWLANRVADSGLALHAGDVVLSGTMTGAHPITGQPSVVTYTGLASEPISISVAGR